MKGYFSLFFIVYYFNLYYMLLHYYCLLSLTGIVIKLICNDEGKLEKIIFIGLIVEKYNMS